MKKRLTPILTISIGLILVAGIAYAAADRRKYIKQVYPPADPVHEEEALRAEMLEALEGQEKKSPAIAESRQIVGSRAEKKTGRSESRK